MQHSIKSSLWVRVTSLAESERQSHVNNTSATRDTIVHIHTALEAWSNILSSLLLT